VVIIQIAQIIADKITANTPRPNNSKKSTAWNGLARFMFIVSDWDVLMFVIILVGLLMRTLHQ
jgi:hypothetical protein